MPNNFTNVSVQCVTKLPTGTKCQTVQVPLLTE